MHVQCHSIIDTSSLISDTRAGVTVPKQSRKGQRAASPIAASSPPPILAKEGTYDVQYVKHIHIQCHIIDTSSLISDTRAGVTVPKRSRRGQRAASPIAASSPLPGHSSRSSP